VVLNSAPGRSRMERLWGTLPSRLRPPLRRAGVGSDVEAANRWLTDVYMASHNSRFAVAPSQDGSAFVTFVGDLDDIFCIEAERVVSAHRRQSPKRQAEPKNQPRKFAPRQSLGTAWTRSTWPCRLQEQQKPKADI